MAELVCGGRSILIGSLSGLNFAKWTAKMDHSQTDLTDLCSSKRYSKGNILALSRNFLLVV